MYSQTAPLLILALFFVTVFTAPLNINMGNYSPAMVVGDGAIAFHDTDGAANLMASLQGADVEDDDNGTGRKAPGNGGGAGRAPGAGAPGAGAGAGAGGGAGAGAGRGAGAGAGAGAGGGGGGRAAGAGAPQFQPVQAGVEGIGRKAILSSS
ncbi:unnamed protein product [Blumeria hordei]|uniref:Glycine-rich protein n=1 Tax=Blumeria hordei TaxID=2867405 RepID=A0A383V3E2_BLUHO|nr:unnamed protein product [Blumeria hordei]